MTNIWQFIQEPCYDIPAHLGWKLRVVLLILFLSALMTIKCHHMLTITIAIVINNYYNY